MYIPKTARLYGFEVVDNVQIAQDTMEITVKCPEVAQGIQPGQFVNVKVPGNAAELLRLPLSYSWRDKESGCFKMIYAVVGEGTRRMQTWNPGTTSDLVGILGHGFYDLDKPGRALLVSGGVGNAPILGLAQKLFELGRPYDLVMGYRDKDHVCCEQEAQKLAPETLMITTDDGSYGFKGFTTDAMRQLLAEKDYEAVYTCGPKPMMAGVARLAQESGIHCQVSMEAMMSCGFAACGTCNIPMAAGGYLACCKAGPVFDGKEVAWDK